MSALMVLGDMQAAMAAAGRLSKSGLIPDALKGKPDDVLVVLLTGAELGIPPMRSMTSIHVVKGRPVLSADLMAALVLGSPRCREFRVTESTDKVCTYSAARIGQTTPTLISYTMAQATQAGLTGSQTWKAHPVAMLRARACAAAARAVFPDLLMGVLESDEAAEVTAREVEVVPSAPQVSPQRALPPAAENARPEEGPPPPWVAFPAPAEERRAALEKGLREAQARSDLEAVGASIKGCRDAGELSPAAVASLGEVYKAQLVRLTPKAPEVAQ